MKIWIVFRFLYQIISMRWFVVIFYHDQITVILVTENIVKYVKLFHHSSKVRWKCTICIISGSLPEKPPSENLTRKKNLLHQTIRREITGGVPSVDLGRILLLWPVITEMVINYQIKAQLLIWNASVKYYIWLAILRSQHTSLLTSHYWKFIFFKTGFKGLKIITDRSMNSYKRCYFSWWCWMLIKP